MAESFSSSRYFMSSPANVTTMANLSSYLHRVDQLEISTIRSDCFLNPSTVGDSSLELDDLYRTHYDFFRSHDTDQAPVNFVTDSSNEIVSLSRCDSSIYSNTPSHDGLSSTDYSMNEAKKISHFMSSEISSVSGDSFSSSMGYEDCHEDFCNDPNTNSHRNSVLSAERRRKPKIRSKAKSVASGEFTDYKVGYLTKWFLDNRLDPYPTTQMKAQFARTLKLSYGQISDWFTNKRKRHWTPVVKFAIRPPRDAFEALLVTENPDTASFLHKKLDCVQKKDLKKNHTVSRKPKMKPTNFTSEIGETQNCGQSRPMRLKKVEALQRISQMRKDTEDLNEKSDSNFDSDICESASLCPGKHSYTEASQSFHISKKGKYIASNNANPTIPPLGQSSFDNFDIFDQNFDFAIWGSKKDPNWSSGEDYDMI